MYLSIGSASAVMGNQRAYIYIYIYCVVGKCGCVCVWLNRSSSGSQSPSHGPSTTQLSHGPPTTQSTHNPSWNPRRFGGGGAIAAKFGSRALAHYSTPATYVGSVADTPLVTQVRAPHAREDKCDED